MLGRQSHAVFPRRKVIDEQEEGLPQEVIIHVSRTSFLLPSDIHETAAERMFVPSRTAANEAARNENDFFIYSGLRAPVSLCGKRMEERAPVAASVPPLPSKPKFLVAGSGPARTNHTATYSHQFAIGSTLLKLQLPR